MKIPAEGVHSISLSEVNRKSKEVVTNWSCLEKIEAREEIAALFIQGCTLTKLVDAGKYSEQYLLMIPIPEKKGTPTFDVATLLEAKNITAIQRAREKYGQIYFWDKLHKVIHLSITKSQLELLQTFMDVNIIKNTENVSYEKENNHVRNIDPDLLGEQMQISFETIFKGVQHEFDMKESKRGTFALSLGYTTNNSNVYSDNRSSILRTIIPNLVNNTSQLSENIRRELGKVALLVSTTALKKFGLTDHFNLPDTEAGKKRKELRKAFGRNLMINEADLDSFKFEGIFPSIVFNLNPHLDSENDTSENQSGTIAMTHYIPVNIVENKKFKKVLTKLNYKDDDYFPFTLIFYSRQCCRSFYNFAMEIEKLQDSTHKADKIIASSIVQVKGERDYDGRIFDDPSHSFLDRIMQGLSSQSGQYPVKLQYDPMSKWSIVLDMTLRFGCYCTTKNCFDSKSNVTAGDVIIICLFCIKVGIHKAVALLALFFEGGKMKMEGTDGKLILLRKMMNILEDQNITQEDVEAFKKMIFSHCESAHKVEKDVESRNAFCYKLQDGIESLSFRPTKEQVIDLIQVLSLCGILPLTFLDWCPSHSIEEFFKDEDPSTIPDFVKEKRKLKTLFYGSMMRNILLIEKNAESDTPSHSYYSYRTPTGEIQMIQRFFRLVFTGVYKCHLEMLIYPSKNAMKKSSNVATIALGDWKNNDKKNGLIYWENEIVEESSHLFISKSLKHFFSEAISETTKRNLQNTSQEREEKSSPAATNVQVTPESATKEVKKRRRLPDFHMTVMDVKQLSDDLDRCTKLRKVMDQSIDNDDGIHDELIDSESESEEAMSWLNKKSKEKEATDIKSIPKRKRHNTDLSQAIPPQESIKRKKTKSRSPPPISSLIANMLPVDTKKRRPAIRDWKSNEDYRKFKTRESKPSAKSSSNQPPVGAKKEENRQVVRGANIAILSAGRNESKKSVQLKLKAIITKVPMSKFHSSEGSTNTTSTTSNVLDCHGSFMKEEKEEKLTFGDLENRRQIPIFPEDFSRDERQWPLEWWGIQKPSDELLNQHDGRRNSRSRSSRERGPKGSKRDDHQRSEQTNRLNADGRWDRNWDEEREEKSSPAATNVQVTPESATKKVKKRWRSRKKKNFFI